MSPRVVLAVILSSVAVGCASSSALSRRVTPEAQQRLCADLLAETNATVWRVSVDSDCVLRVHDKSGAVTAQLEVSGLRSEPRPLRRVVVTSNLLFLLRWNPGRLEAYQLPTLAHVEVIGLAGLREPADAAFREGVDGSITAYILDNADDSERRRSSEEPVMGDVLRVSLVHNISAGRQIITARLVDRFGGVASDWYDWRVLQSIDLTDGKVRIVVRENRHRYAAFYTFDGTFLEWQPLAGGR